MIEIIPADKRQSQPRGAKILIAGPTGIGKTSQLHTLNPATTLFVDIEAGDLSVQDFAVEMSVRPGSAGEGGWLKQSKSGDSYMLDCEFLVLEGPHAKRKLWSNYTIEGTTDGHKKASDISRSKLRAIIESAYGIKPNDSSQHAAAMRKVTGFDAFHGLRFVAKLGVEPARDGYPARNVILEVITPDRPQWQKLDQAFAPTPQATAQPQTTTVTPAWAR